MGLLDQGYYDAAGNWYPGADPAAYPEQPPPLQRVGAYTPRPQEERIENRPLFSPTGPMQPGMPGVSVSPQRETPADKLANFLLPDSREGRSQYPNYTRGVEYLTGSRGVGSNTIGLLDAVGATSAYGTGEDIGRAYQNSDIKGMAIGAGETVLSALPPFSVGGKAVLGTFVLASKIKSADEIALAEQMLARGANRDEVWKATGIAKDPSSGKLVAEISDDKARLGPAMEKKDRGRGFEERGNPKTLGEAYVHPELYAAEPKLAQTPIVRDRNVQNSDVIRGQFDPKTGIDVRRSLPDNVALPTLAHEGQHALQRPSGMPGGTSPAAAGSYENYISSPGEGGAFGAYNVEHRMPLTAEERRATPPWHTSKFDLQTPAKPEGLLDGPAMNMEPPKPLNGQVIPPTTPATAKPATGLLGADSPLEGAFKPDKAPVRGQTDREIVRDQKKGLNEQELETLERARQANPAFARESRFIPAQELKPLLNNPDALRQTMRLLEVLPNSAEMVSMMKAGAPKQGWYRGSSQALIDTFGREDAPRFASLLAATSPQTSVESNLMNTLNIWKNWTAAGRPTDEASILRIMGQSVQGTKGEDSVLKAWIGNTMRALQATDPRTVTLSGPKVNSFFRNLADDVYAYTNDAWIANATGIDQDILRLSPTAKQLAAGNPGFSPAYTAVSARGRRAANSIGMYPAEGQETAWSLAMPLMERAGALGMTSKEILQGGHLTPDIIRGTPDFSTLLQDPRYRKILEEAGYGDQLDRMLKNPFQFPTKLPELTLADQNNLMKTADRLDQLRGMRNRESRSLVQGFKTAPEDKVTAVVPAGGLPGAGTGHAEDLLTDTPGRKAAFSSRIQNALTDAQNVDIINKGIGLPPIQNRSTQTITRTPEGLLGADKTWVAPVELPLKTSKRGVRSIPLDEQQRVRTAGALRATMTAQPEATFSAQVPDLAGRNITVQSERGLKPDVAQGLLAANPASKIEIVDSGAGATLRQPNAPDFATAGRQAGALGKKEFAYTSDVAHPLLSKYDLRSEWAAGVGSRQVTEKLMKEIDALKGKDLKRLDNAELRQAAGDIIEAYETRSVKHGSPLRPDLMNLLTAIRDGGIAGLKAARANPGVSLPGLAVVPASGLLGGSEPATGPNEITVRKRPET